MNTNYVVLVTIAEFLRALERAIKRTPAAATPDAIADVLGDVQWNRIDDWESSSDIEIARQTGLLDVPFAESSLIVTEASFSPDRGAFLVPASRLGDFVKEHLDAYGECFFNGDVIVADTAGHHVWLFHHDGLYALVQ